MNMLLKTGLATVAVSVAADGSAKTSNEDGTATARSKSIAQTHSTTGTGDSVSGQRVTISHGPTKSLDWPAMTMPFTAKDAASLQGIKAVDRVAFTFSKSGNDPALTSIAKQ